MLAAAVCTAQTSDVPANTCIGKQMIQKVHNKIESHREVGLPDAISHLLDYPDHYTGADYVNINTNQLLSYSKSMNSITATDPTPEIRTTAERAHDGEPDSQIVRVEGRNKLINVFDDYPYRGPDLAGFSLYDYTALYYKGKGMYGIYFTEEHPCGCSSISVF